MKTRFIWTRRIEVNTGLAYAIKSFSPECIDRLNTVRTKRIKSRNSN